MNADSILIKSQMLLDLIDCKNALKKSTFPEINIVIESLQTQIDNLSDRDVSHDNSSNLFAEYGDLKKMCEFFKRFFIEIYPTLSNPNNWKESLTPNSLTVYERWNLVGLVDDMNAYRLKKIGPNARLKYYGYE